MNLAEYLSKHDSFLPNYVSFGNDPTKVDLKELLGSGDSVFEVLNTERLGRLSLGMLYKEQWFPLKHITIIE